MDNLENQITGGIQKVITAFETRPIATTIKGLIILWVLKEAIKFFKS